MKNKDSEFAKGVTDGMLNSDLISRINNIPIPKEEPVSSPQPIEKPIVRKAAQKEVKKKEIINASETIEATPDPKEYKLLQFVTDKIAAETFIKSVPRLYIKFKSKQTEQNFSALMHNIIESMEVAYIEKYGKLLKPDDDQIFFYQKRNTKSTSNTVYREINEKSRLVYKLTLKDYKRITVLMHTFYSNLKKKPSKFSFAYFFFEICDFTTDLLK